MDLSRYGPWTLIVGGSEGIGSAFARQLAAQGFHLVLVARNSGPLDELAAALRVAGTQVRTVAADVGAPDALDLVRATTEDLVVGLLIFNAGANSVRDDFLALDPQTYRSVIGVNVIAPSEFCHHYGGMMRQRGRGGIILTGSAAGYVGTRSLATYCAAKAFSRIFGEALWSECQPFGVDVLHLVIGFTATPAMARLGYDLTNAQDPAEVAKEALDNIVNGPLWHLGGQAAVEQAERQTRIADRAAIVRGVTTPQRK